MLFDHASRILVLAQSYKFRVSQPICLCPFQEFDLSDGFWPQDTSERHYDRPVLLTIFSFSEARRNRSGALMRSQVRLKSLAGPLHRNSSIDLNTGTSTRSVARVRNSSASSQPAKSASARGRALRNVGSH